jgi:hypothetical protein
MALSPVITATLNNKCKTITVTDSTGVYHVSTNTGGWETPNEAGSAITSAKLIITNFNGAVQTVDVTSQIPDTVAGNFSFNDITLDAYVDGNLKIRYELIGASGSYAYDLTLLVTCNVRACIDAMWAKIACSACAGNCDVAELIDDANLAEGLYQALCSGASCCQDDCVTTLITSLNDLCSWNNCNC